MKPTIEVVRFCYSEMGTFGTMQGPSFHCYTVERPWKNNEPYVSCIPCGTYKAEKRRYNKGGYDTFELCDVPGRSFILVHKGNVKTDVQGCIALGMMPGVIGDQWAVVNSKQAFGDFWATFGDAGIAAFVVRNVENMGVIGDGTNETDS